MLVGYIRVSTTEQDENLQVDALRSAGCEHLFTDTISGAKAERRGLAEALAFLRPGDTLVVWKLDRAGKSLQHLIAQYVTNKRGRFRVADGEDRHQYSWREVDLPPGGSAGRV
jgi:DNA invertase Pin-like site-specific DNA recombinase